MDGYHLSPKSRLQEFIADLLPEIRDRLAVFFAKVSPADSEFSGPVMTAVVLGELSELMKAAEQRQSAVEQLVTTSITDRAALLAQSEAQIESLTRTIEVEKAWYIPPEGFWAFWQSSATRVWGAYVLVVLLVVGNVFWAADCRIKVHYEACQTASTFQIMLREKARHEGHAQIVRYLSTNKEPLGCY